jgi:hypothetical protein
MQALADIMSVSCVYDKPHVVQNLSIQKNGYDKMLVTLPEILTQLDMVTSDVFYGMKHTVLRFVLKI